MKKAVVMAAFFFLMLLAACSDRATKEDPTVDIRELVHTYSTGDFEDVSASITSHQLIVTDRNERKTVYELPEDEFFLSIAPYVETTHPCAIHSLTGCRGELAEKEFYVYIQDDKGNVIIDERMTSLENGFIDLWLPRNETFQVKIEYEGKVAESEISTFKGDNTCITTMRLL